MAVIKISARGADPGGLIRYMFGKGNSNEHTNQRTVAGTCEYARKGENDAIRQVHQDLRAYSQANPQVTIKGGHVWQASISLAPGETPLTDDKWKAVADDYMRGMGFADPAKSPVRWTAVNHGLNTGGSDHIHIVMSLVREDGSRVNIHNDALRSSNVMKELERKHGLQELEGRGAGTAARTFTGGEKGKAQDNGHEIERVEIERIVRGAAGASQTEAEFVRRLRAAGMEIRPRVSGDIVTGYSVGMPGTDVHFAGGKIARDLTLPRLRQRWAESPAGTDAAALEWIHGEAGKPLVTGGRETRKIMVPPQAVTRELEGLQQELAGATTVELREIGQDLAGALALGAEHDPKMAAMSRAAGRHAQTRSYNFRPKNRLMNTGLLILQASDPLSPMGSAIMLKQVLSTLQTLHDFHRARCRVAFGKGNTMTHPAPDDGIGETAEGLAVVGVTIGAQAVQRALYDKEQARNNPGAGTETPVLNGDWPVEDPDRELQPVGAPAMTGTEGDAALAGASHRAPDGQTPKAWEMDPMTTRQRLAVKSYARNAGLDADKDLQGFDTWTKADASAAIGQFQKHSRDLEKISPLLTPQAQSNWDPTKIKPRTTAVKPSAGPISGTDIRNQKGRGGR